MYSIHNCGESPMLDIQIREYQCPLYSLATYPDRGENRSISKILTLSATKVGRFLLLAHREPSKQWVCHHPVNTPFPLGERRLCWHPHGGCVLFSPLSPSQTLQLPTIIILSYFLISFLGDSSPRLKSGAFSPRFCKRFGSLFKGG